MPKHRYTIVPANAYEYAHARDADPYPRVRKSPYGYNPDYYDTVWDQGSRNAAVTEEDLLALGFDTNDDTIERWADDCEPYRVPARHRVHDEWETTAEVEPAAEPEPMPEYVFSWVLDRDEVVRLARQELIGEAGKWLRATTQLRRHMGWTAMQMTAVLHGSPVSTHTAQRIADLLSTSIVEIASPKDWDEATG